MCRVPVSVLALHLFDVLIYDFDHPGKQIIDVISSIYFVVVVVAVLSKNFPDDSNRWFYLIETVAHRLILRGILQPILALLLAFIILPTASIIILFGELIFPFHS